MSELVASIIAAGIGGAIAVLVFYILSYRKHKNDQPDSQLLLSQLHELHRTLDSKLGESSRFMHDSVRSQFNESQRLIKDITKEITEVKETGRQVASFGEHLKELQQILKNPKQRGILGEYYLETTLKNVLPPNSYQMQYQFEDGNTIVDAVVFVREKIIPIDSKFSLENYNKLLSATEAEQEQLERSFKADIKNRIEETAKYIRPDEGTMDFAFMFIPHEGIYYDLLVAEIGGMKTSTQDLIEYAFKRNVLIVSPTSFLAFLQTVLQGLRSLQIEESAKEIQKQVGLLAKHLDAYETYHDKLGKNLQTVVNQYEQSSNEFKKIDKDITKITGDTIEYDPTPINQSPDEEL